MREKKIYYSSKHHLTSFNSLISTCRFTSFTLSLVSTTVEDVYLVMWVFNHRTRHRGAGREFSSIQKMINQLQNAGRSGKANSCMSLEKLRDFALNKSFPIHIRVTTEACLCSYSSEINHSCCSNLFNSHSRWASTPETLCKSRPQTSVPVSRAGPPQNHTT